MVRSDLSRQRQLTCWAMCGATILFAYASLAITPIFGGWMRFRYWFLVTLVVALTLYLVAFRSSGRSSLQRQTRFGVACWAIVLTLCTADICYGIFFNYFVQQPPREDRVPSTPLISAKQLVVPFFQDGNLVYCSPGYRCQAEVYGDLCEPDQLASKTIREKVIELRTVDIEIDRHGYRRSTALTDATIIALGDSFTFGAGIASSRTWVQLLNDKFRPCYNLGFLGGSPAGEMARLESMFDNKVEPGSIEHVVWMLFEGNDLEDKERPLVWTDSSSLLDGTFLAGVVTSLESIRDSSIISRAIRGELVVRSAVRQVDGIALTAQLGFSETLGFKLFHPQYIQRISRPLPYIQNHPNVPVIEQAFARMDKLAQQAGFHVTVVIAPSAPRIYHDEFTNMPHVEPPHCIRFLATLAQQHDFTCVDLLPIMKRIGSDQLLFFRDDTHWNELGHEVAATAVMEQLKNDRGQTEASFAGPYVP